MKFKQLCQQLDERVEERRKQYTPLYPKTLDEAIESLTSHLSEYEQSKTQNEYNKGFCLAMRISLNTLRGLKRNLAKKNNKEEDFNNAESLSNEDF